MVAIHSKAKGLSMRLLDSTRLLHGATGAGLPALRCSGWGIRSARRRAWHGWTLCGLGWLLAAHALAADELLPAALAGLWVVQDSACAGCDPAQGPETGAQLRIAAAGYQNPFAADCSAGLQVHALPTEPLAQIQERLGLPARWLAGAGTPAAAAPASAGMARPFRLSCPGRPALVVLLLPEGDLLMPVEASTVLRFRHGR
jgi:hypothetical protein